MLPNSFNNIFVYFIMYTYAPNYRDDPNNPAKPRDNSAYEKNRAEHARGDGTRQTYGDVPSLGATLKGIGKAALGASGHLAKTYYKMGKGVVKAPWRTAKGVANLTGARTRSGITKLEKKQIKRSTSDRKGGKRHLRKKSSTRKRGKKSSTRKRCKKSSTRKRCKK